MQKLDPGISSAFRWIVSMGYSDRALAHIAERYHQFPSNILYGAKLYLMDDGRWLILDYLNIPDAPRHYIDCIEGDICNMNVRIISDETKREIEKNQEIFQEEFQ